MRVSTQTFQKQWLNTINEQQSALVRVQQQISSGKRISSAADDPLGASQIVSLQQNLDRLDGYAKNSDAAQRRLQIEETTLDKVGDALDRVRELAIQAGGAAQTRETRTAIANEAEQLLKSLLDLANAQDSEGRFLFAGNRVNSQPFSSVGGNVVYGGDDGTRSQRIGDNRVVQESDAGSDVFQRIRNGNGTFSVMADGANNGTGFYKAAIVSDPSAWVADNYEIRFSAPDTYDVVDGAGATIASGSFADGDTISFAGAAITIEGEPATGDVFHVDASRNQDMFATVQQFVTNMLNFSTGPANSAKKQGDLNSSLLNLDQALEHVGIVRSRIGARLNIIDEQSSTNADVSLQLSETMASVRDVDYASAIAELEARLFGLEAAQKTFQSTRQFSLFDIL